MTAIALVFAMTSTGLGAFATCADQTVSEVVKPATFAQYRLELNATIKDRQRYMDLVSKARVEDFWFNTWPALVAEAEQNETTVSEMFEEPLILMKMFTDALNTTGALRRQMQVLLSGLLKDLQGLENLKAGGKLKASHWEKIPRVMSALYGMGVMVFEMEEVTLHSPTFDPTKLLSKDQILRILDALDVNVLDAMSLATEELNRDAEVYRQSQRGQSTQAPTPAFPENEPPTMTPAQAEEIRIKLPGQPAVTVSSDQLYSALKEALPLVAGKIYRATSAKGDEYSIEISRDISKADSNGERESVRRLLKTIMHGTGSKSGIKNLFDIGPNIIEIKAIFRGHKRIIGCMEGRHLRLLSYMELGSSRAAYARTIPSDLCR